ncbi:MAG: RsmE family RNA methyltransferase [Candidatus Eremiobacteraeota bacterium]|nr:RsmE family RNA methyltransferase [Candidatus Eremiobacteraeota bacterium]
MKTGERIEIIDSGAQRFFATLTLANHRVTAHLDEVAPPVLEGDRFQVSIAQALPKGQKMDLVVEKLTELGVAEIYPLYSERTVVEDIGPGKFERWRRLAKSASEQCGRATIPVLHEVQSFDAFVECFAKFDVVLFAWELADMPPLREKLPGLLQDATTILAIVGPEGGFSNDEAARAREAGAHLVSLGRRILRTETAALVIAAILNYLA